MNERIQELWSKAAESTAAYPSGQNNSWETQVNFLEKFAELIVRECIEVGGPEDSYRDEWFNAKVDSVAKIKQHFGVEE
jgi:hypothetical protein